MIKTQDLIFFAVLFYLFRKNTPDAYAIAGLASLGLSAVLYLFWILFTAERLTWYAGVFFLIFILISLRDLRGVE